MGVASAQPPAQPDPQPIYRVTVVSRNLEAVNYEHRGGPTPIDFQGTVLLPHAKGTAIVESHRGSVAIDAKFEHLEAPTRFGREYLTYVLWAISPEGRPKNLGELLVDSSNKAHIKVTTDLQAFGLMVTAEPYYSVSIPSDVVVAENVVRPDTIGAREEVTAKYELMPRGQYTMNIQPAQLRSMEWRRKSCRTTVMRPFWSYIRRRTRSRSRGRWAPINMRLIPATRRRPCCRKREDMNARKMDTHAIVSAAREAAQMAEDARTIAVKRRDEERHQQEVQHSQDQSELRRKAEEDAAQARADAEAEAQQAAHARQQAPRPSGSGQSRATGRASSAPATASTTPAVVACALKIRRWPRRQHARATAGAVEVRHCDARHAPRPGGHCERFDVRTGQRHAAFRRRPAPWQRRGNPVRASRTEYARGRLRGHGGFVGSSARRLCGPH